MIEKIMKAVKSSNKRRGRNITIGAVVGFLLSCTAVMGATGDNYLWIKKENGEEIKFSIDGTTAFDGNWDTENPYSNNNWDTATKTYTNNMMLSSSEANGKDGNGRNISYGLRLSGELTNVNFVNNGSVIGTMSSSSGSGSGIYNSGTMGNIANAGVISGTGSGTGSGIYNSGTMENIINTGVINGSGNGDTGNGFGINNYFSSTTKNITNITNTGVISASTNGSGPCNGYGIKNFQGTIENITNIGVINGYGDNIGYGIYNEAASEMGKITNTGIISGSGNGNGYGISSDGGDAEITTITNAGVIYGKNSAIAAKSGGTITTIDNYGILATDGDDVVDDKDSSITTENNYGLYIGKDGKITLGQAISSPAQVVVGYDKDGKEIKKYMTIRNATLIGTPGEETETESFVLAGEVEKFDNSILNGKNETLKVSGTGNQITDSIINAYQTAVVMNENMSTLTLNNTVVNGGISGENTVKIEG
ncbi:MAG: autotransporter domain-containing protein, partial [Fusobacterium varium]|nr:autotransporter domain-containing protein [Fusobacterium varium]